MSLIKKDVKIAVRINNDTYDKLQSSYNTCLIYNPSLTFSDFIRSILISFISMTNKDNEQK